VRRCRAAAGGSGRCMRTVMTRARHPPSAVARSAAPGGPFRCLCSPPCCLYGHGASPARSCARKLPDNRLTCCVVVRAVCRCRCRCRSRQLSRTSWRTRTPRTIRSSTRLAAVAGRSAACAPPPLLTSAAVAALAAAAAASTPLTRSAHSRTWCVSLTVL
jgi:hypothetical protein